MTSVPRVSSGFAGRVITCLLLAAFVFSSRAWLIRSWGSPTPFWDQWDAEALALYLPWLRDDFRWSDLFAAQKRGARDDTHEGGERKEVGKIER